MKPNDLFKNWDEYRDRIEHRLVELSNDDLLFLVNKKVEISVAKKRKPVKKEL